MIFLAPHHVRAKNNKIYYENIIKNKTLLEQKQKIGDIDTKDEVNLISKILNDKNYQINNHRPDSLEERLVYEKLCRQNETQV